MSTDNEFTADYALDDCIYRVTASQEVHIRLQTDKRFLKEYTKGCVAPPELVGVAPDMNTTSESSPGHSKFKWHGEATRFFIEEYRKRKDKIREPKIKKKNLWMDILADMRTAGFLVEDDDTLDRKMRNMNRTYKTIKDNNNKNSTGRGRVQWEYYDLFEDIFSTDRTVNLGPVVSSMENSDVPILLDESTSSTTSGLEAFSDSPGAKSVDGLPTHPKKSTAAKRMSSLHYLRKKQLSNEERKLEIFHSVSETLKETNILLRERNELLRQFVNSRGTATATNPTNEGI